METTSKAPHISSRNVLVKDFSWNELYKNEKLKIIFSDKVMLVSIIIPTYNRRNILRECLLSVFDLDYLNKEVIVVDDASNDGTEEMLRSEFKSVIYIRNYNRSGVGSKNIGIQRCQGKYVWFLDSDSFISNKYCLSNMVTIMENNKDIGTIGGEVIERDGVKYVRKLRFLRNEISTPLDKMDSKDLILHEVDYSPTCNCLVRRDLIQKIGGFFGSYFYGGEDAELGKRIKDLGLRNVIDYRTLVEHRRSNISRTANFKLFHKNKMRFVIRNFGVGKFLIIPFIEIINMLEGYKELKGKSVKDIKGLDQGGKKYNKLSIGLNYLFYLIYGYFWNLIFLPVTLKNRNINKN